MSIWIVLKHFHAEAYGWADNIGRAMYFRYFPKFSLQKLTYSIPVW